MARPSFTGVLLGLVIVVQMAIIIRQRRLLSHARSAQCGVVRDRRARARSLSRGTKRKDPPRRVASPGSEGSPGKPVVDEARFNELLAGIDERWGGDVTRSRATGRDVLKARAWFESRGDRLWKYESPLMDIESSADPAVRARFSRLPGAFLAVDARDLVRRFWRARDAAGGATLAEHFARAASGAVALGVGSPSVEMQSPVDAAVLYAMLRFARPRRLLEIGAGSSTRVAAAALLENARDDPRAPRVDHVCVEPFRADKIGPVVVDEARGGRPRPGHAPPPTTTTTREVVPDGGRPGDAANWRVRVLETKLQFVDPSEFDALAAGDVLFIDSSHVIQPYGDTLYEILWLLPRLAPGVFVHVHDVFLPNDYPPGWMYLGRRQYTEQWLLAAFLHGNDEWEVAWPTNHMNTEHRTLGHGPAAPDLLARSGKGGSFWFRRTGGTPSRGA